MGISSGRKIRFPLLVTVLAALFAIALAACGSDDASPAAQTDSENASLPSFSDDDGIPIRLITLTDSTFSMDDLVAVGYKKSKQFDTDTVPGATDIWYGFHDQRDIEVRVYPSHQAALDFGVESADAVIGKRAGQTDYLIPVVNRYPAYAVVGNLVMLCERELGVCEDLIDKLD